MFMFEFSIHIEHVAISTFIFQHVRRIDSPSIKKCINVSNSYDFNLQERVAAALENAHLLEVVNQCLTEEEE